MEKRSRAPGEDYRLPNRILGGLLEKQDIPFVDLLPVMRGDPGRDRFYYVRDGTGRPKGIGSRPRSRPNGSGR